MRLTSRVHPFRNPQSEIEMAERVGFEPTYRLRGNLISSQARYNRFATSPLQKTRIHRRGAEGAEKKNVFVSACSASPR